MKKKVLSIIICAISLISLSSCGNNNSKPAENATTTTTAANATDKQEVSDNSETTYSSKEESTTGSDSSSGSYSEGDYDKILQEIRDDFDSVISEATTKLEEVYSSIGDTYDGYVNHEGELDAWYSDLYQETEKLFQRTFDKNVDFYKLIAASSQRAEYKFTHDLLGDLYDNVYKEAYGNYYDNIYKEIFGNLYDKYYKGIISDARKSVDYKDWSDVSSNCYKKWSDTKSDIYRIWSDSKSLIYSLRSEISSEFLYNDNFDVDSIVSKVTSQEAVQSDNSSDDNNSETTTAEPSEPAETAVTSKKTNTQPIVGTLYTVGKDVAAGQYLFECTTSDYGLNFICFNSDTEYDSFVNADRFTNGEFGAAVEQNALYDMYLYKDDIAYVGLKEGNILLIDGGEGDFKKIESLDKDKMYPGIYFVGSDISEGKYTFTYDDAKYGSVKVAAFANMDDYYSYHKASRFTNGEETSALESNAETLTYLYKGSSQIINVKSGVLLIDGGTVSVK